MVVVAELKADSVLNQFHAIGGEIGGGVFGDTDHDHPLRQGSAVTVGAGREDGT